MAPTAPPPLGARVASSKVWPVVLVLVFLGACVQLGPTAPTLVDLPPQLRRAVAASIAEHERLALREEASGELLAASEQWHVLTLLAPGEERYQARLAALREQIRGLAAERLASGRSAYRRGDLDAARTAMLGVIALSPDTQDAQQILREIERQRSAAIQAQHAARFKARYVTAPARVAEARQTQARVPEAGTTAERPVVNNGGAAQVYELEQALELFKAGDTAGGLRGMLEYAMANPGDTAGRERLAEAVWRRALALEAQGKREAGLDLLERAVAVRGSTPAAWSAHRLTMRQALSKEYYDRAWRVYRTDVSQAIRLWESSLRYDPQNTRSALKLQEAGRMQESLRRIERRDPP